MNKFDLMNLVWTSDLTSTQKNLLCYLISKSNKDWESWPSTAKLAQVAGIKYEKNFTLLDHLKGYITVRKVGRNNRYVLNIPAVEGVSEGTVILKNTASRNTPAPADNTPSSADNTPAPADNTPAVEGTNTTRDTTRESTRESTNGLALSHQRE